MNFLYKTDKNFLRPGYRIVVYKPQHVETFPRVKRVRVGMYDPTTMEKRSMNPLYGFRVKRLRDSAI